MKLAVARLVRERQAVGLDLVAEIVERDIAIEERIVLRLLGW